MHCSPRAPLKPRAHPSAFGTRRPSVLSVFGWFTESPKQREGNTGPAAGSESALSQRGRVSSGFRACRPTPCGRRPSRTGRGGVTGFTHLGDACPSAGKKCAANSVAVYLLLRSARRVQGMRCWLRAEEPRVLHQRFTRFVSWGVACSSDVSSR